MALLGIAVILSIFYGQYRWVTGGMVAISVEQHGDSLAASFERRARGQLYRLSNAVIEAGIDSPAVTSDILDRAIRNSETLNGLRYTHADGSIFVSGQAAEEPVTGNVLWRQDRLYMKYPVEKDDEPVGSLTGSFDLATLRAETAAFEEELVALGTQSRRTSFLRIGGATLVTIFLCGIVIMLFARIQAERIRALKVQAEKLSDADYGEPLPVVEGDLLGDLAAVFNDMRDKLRRTTVSRDYVDSVLSSMNEAIIVTAPDGVITRVNEATTRMLGYREDELVGNPVDLVVDMRKGRTLSRNTRPGVPREAFLSSKSGDRVPVSYTSSSIEAAGDFYGHRIYAAQNISERRKAEKRIRYLARIDALTKVPNRMQFQHLLQRAIARAKRKGKSIALFYIDIDHFKEINDTFGHLAGDATLETVAERLKKSLPEQTVVGRLAGDEFAVIVDKFDVSPDRKSTIDKIARQLLDSLAEPFSVQGHEVFMTASAGIAFYPTRCAERDRPDPKRRCRSLSCEEIGRQPACPLHAGDERGGCRTSHDQEQVEASFRTRRTARALPTEVRSEDGSDFRRRSSRAVGAAGARHHFAVGFYPACRGNQPDHRDWRVGSRQGLRRFSILATIGRLTRSGIGQPVAETAAAGKLHAANQLDYA